MHNLIHKAAEVLKPFGAIRKEIDIVDLDEKTSFTDYLKTHGELLRVE